MIGEAR